MMKKEGFRFWKETLGSAAFVVAPMVDQSELAWRLLSRRYGAQLCYTPMLHASVFVRDSNYRKESLATCSADRPLIVQFCANSPETLLKAAKYAEIHCDAIDLNLGCPQAIARRGHYGAFLQDEWELLEEMIKLCAAELKVPITAKIRVFEEVEKTVRYAQMLERAGVQLLTVHGRTIEQKGMNTGLASWSHIKAVRESLSIPVFANGNIQYLPDVRRCIQETGVQGVMTAEGNLHNPGLFDGEDHVVWDMAEEYLELVNEYPCPLPYIRGHLFKLFQHALQRHLHVREMLANAKTLEDMKNSVECLKEASKGDVERYREDPESLESDLPRPYWICQPYVRPSAEKRGEREPEKAAFRDSQLENLKRTLSDHQVAALPLLEALSKNKLKKLKRNHRKVFVTDGKEEKFPKCQCGNPKGLRCAFDSCKRCCREKVSRERKDCPGHRFLAKLKFHENKEDCRKEITPSEDDLDTTDLNSSKSNSTECPR